MKGRAKKGLHFEDGIYWIPADYREKYHGYRYYGITQCIRCKIYRLVEEKREDVNQACRYFCNVFLDIFEEYMEKIPSQ